MINGILGQASNIKPAGINPPYTKEDFLGYYPQFEGLVPDATLQMYVDLGRAVVNIKRFGTMWTTAIGLFIAHFCTLYMQSMKDAGADAQSVLSVSASGGMITSESADGLSYSRDLGSVVNDLGGWGAFKMSTFGIQFATLAKLCSRGGMLVW